MFKNSNIHIIKNNKTKQKELVQNIFFKKNGMIILLICGNPDAKVSRTYKFC